MGERIRREEERKNKNNNNNKIIINNNLVQFDVCIQVLCDHGFSHLWIECDRFVPAVFAVVLRARYSAPFF